MVKRTRRNHSPDQNAKVALAAMKGDWTVGQHSDQYGVDASQLQRRKSRCWQALLNRTFHFENA